MADQGVTVSNLQSVSVLSNTDLIVVANTTNAYTANTPAFRSALFAATSNASIPVPSYTVGLTPNAAIHANGAVIYVSDGANGSPCFATSNGTTWLVIATIGGAISNT